MTVHSSLRGDTPVSAGISSSIGNRIPMRDGATLHAAIWRPRQDDRPVSVVLEITPYGVDHLHPDGVFWATNGFAYVAIDVRGRGNSDGEFVPFLNDADDGYDAVEWCAEQPWCDGKVALHGGSYTGINQYLILAAAPPSLCAITPDSTTGHGNDVPRGGVSATFELSWRRLISNRTTQFEIGGDRAAWHGALWEAARTGASLVEAARAAGSPVDEWALEVVDHAEPGPHWERFRASPEALAATNVPVLSITGMYDDSSGGTIANWRRFQACAPATTVAASHLVIGPWDHMGTHFGDGRVGELQFGPDATVPLAELRRDWLRHVLHGAPAPSFLRDTIVLYLTGEEAWRSAASLDACTTGNVHRFLRSVPGGMDSGHSGWIDDEPADGPDATITCDPTDFRTHRAELESREAGTGPESTFHRAAPMNDFMTTLAGNDPTNERFVIEIDGQGVVYTSAPLTTAIDIVGEPELHLHLSCDQRDVDLAVIVHEVTPTGASIFLTSDLLRLSCRAYDGGHEWLVPGEVTPVTFARFKWCQRRVQPGSRLRVAIRHASSIQLTPYPHGRPADAPITHVTIHHDAPRAPRFVLPLATTP